MDADFLLIQKIKKGNEQAMDQFVLKHYPKIYQYCLLRVRDHGYAEDLTQETFLKALLSLDQRHTNMRAWLYTVARNLYYNEVSKNRRVMYVDEYENETEDRANIPLENILSKERNRLLYHAIEHLPERQREIVMMQYFGGLGQKEIAKVLHMTPENVRVSAHRAKKQMKNYMEGQGYEL